MTEAAERERIARDAANWHIEMLEPSSEAQVQAFEAWLNADRRHARAYAREEERSALAARLPRRLLDDAPRRAFAWTARPALAAALAILLAVTGMVWLARGGAPAAQAALANPGPAVRGVTLRDGTMLILDAGARLSLAADPAARAIDLSAGRTRFDIAPDPGRPFTVTVSGTTITASDAVFDVALVDDRVRLWVFEGAVAVAGASAATLGAGQVLTIGPGAVATAITRTDARWPAGRLAFDESRLASVVAVANRRGNPQIILSDDSLGALRVTGVLDIRDTRALARKLAATLGLRVEQRDGAVLLLR